MVLNFLRPFFRAAQPAKQPSLRACQIAAKTGYSAYAIETELDFLSKQGRAVDQMPADELAAYFQIVRDRHRAQNKAHHHRAA